MTKGKRLPRTHAELAKAAAFRKEIPLLKQQAELLVARRCSGKQQPYVYVTMSSGFRDKKSGCLSHSFRICFGVGVKSPSSWRIYEMTEEVRIELHRAMTKLVRKTAKRLGFRKVTDKCNPEDEFPRYGWWGLVQPEPTINPAEGIDWRPTEVIPEDFYSL